MVMYAKLCFGGIDRQLGTFELKYPLQGQYKKAANCLKQNENIIKDKNKTLLA